MSRKILLPILVILLASGLSVEATPTPSPTPKAQKSFLSALKPRVNPSATVPRTNAAVGRGAHLSVDRSAQTPTPTPRPTAKVKTKSSASAHKSPTPSKTPLKAPASPVPTITATPRSTPSEVEHASPKEELPSPSPTQSEIVSPTPTPVPSPTATATSKPAATATPTPTPTPIHRPTKIELTLTKFQPPHGLPGDRDYHSAQLSYRINAPNRMEYPTINFTIESSSGKLFERVFQLASGTAFVEPDDKTEHRVALDPVARDDWAAAYAKSDRATFTWSIEGQSSGKVEKSVKTPWP